MGQCRVSTQKLGIQWTLDGNPAAVGGSAFCHFYRLGVPEQMLVGVPLGCGVPLDCGISLGCRIVVEDKLS